MRGVTPLILSPGYLLAYFTYLERKSFSLVVGYAQNASYPRVGFILLYNAFLIYYRLNTVYLFCCSRYHYWASPATHTHTHTHTPPATV